MTRFLLALAMFLLLVSPSSAQDQRAGDNVTWAYAQVLRASPVYRMVQVPTSEQRCNSARMGPPPAIRGGARESGGCRTVQVVYQERRLVGYDVEYSYKGETYMSRLAADPGSRLRIRVAVTPDDPAVDHR
jgi:uncharacterized protein YcfJ